MDNLMHYCTRPKAECNKASGRPQYRGIIVDYTTKTHEITVLLPYPFDEIIRSISDDRVLLQNRKFHTM